MFKSEDEVLLYHHHDEEWYVATVVEYENGTVYVDDGIGGYESYDEHECFPADHPDIQGKLCRYLNMSKQVVQLEGEILDFLKNELGPGFQY